LAPTPELGTQPLYLSVLGGKLIPEFIQHLVHLVHPVAPQPKGEPHVVNVRRLWVSRQQDRRQGSYRLIEAVVDQLAAGAAFPKNACPEVSPDDSGDADQDDRKKDKE
jgi:hypothetical protein